jgi:hypothetical protein
MEWQPIETAQNGVEVLLWNGQRQFLGLAGSLCPRGVMLREDGGYAMLTPPATHWMPLPNPPA